MRTVSADFAGANFPPGTKVSFVYKDRVWEGTVIKLLLRKARVMIADKRTFKVPYSIMRILESTGDQISLAEIDKTANELLQKHNLDSWKFAFDLAENRGGCCYYDREMICISVTYCIKATQEQIMNTLLHEIAHALAGYRNGHNRKWQQIARSIGCNAQRCHTVEHAPPKWVGKCNCSQITWKRQRLTQFARTAKCSRCDEPVSWKLNTDF